MIIGAHSVIIYSTDPEADHRFLRDVLRLPAVDGGGGYLIFGLPSAEASVHPSSTDNLQQELYLLCDNIEMFVSEMRKNGVPCGPVQDQGWGLLTEVTLPGGGRLGVYQPRHERPAGNEAKEGEAAQGGVIQSAAVARMTDWKLIGWLPQPLPV